MRDNVVSQGHIGKVCESNWSYVLEVGDVDFIMPCGIVVFALFYCRLDMGCDECHVGCQQPDCPHIHVSVCLTPDCVGELIVECARHQCG